MKFKRGETILKELKHHMPFTLVVSLFAGVLVALAFILTLTTSDFLLGSFETIHPLHVLVSAAATAAIYKKYKKSLWESMFVGVIGAILIGSISDVLLPWVAGNILSLETVFHLPIVESPFLILGAGLIGALIGLRFGMFKLTHSLHVFFSVFASLLYLLAFSVAVNLWIVLAISLIVFLVVYIPCCISDIVFPILFIKKPCKDCGHWHDYVFIGNFDGCIMVEKKMKKPYPEYLKERFPPKQGFKDRMEKLLGKAEADEFFEISYTPTPNSIRCNTLKISPGDLKKRLAGYGWKIKQPFDEFPEVMIVGEGLKPGELGNSKEHLLGYFYVQEISSMLPMLALQPRAGEIILDLCASPGSKTTQAAAMMENKGTIIANEVSLGRIGILNSNLERCGVMNTIVTRKEGVALCERLLKKSNLKFDKILVDAPCSGEGTLRKSPKTFLMWNVNMIKKIAGTQRRLASSALKLLKVDCEMIYSTCTLSPEEDEMIVDYLIKNFDVEVEQITLPLKFRCGVCEWEGKSLDKGVEKCLRLYPQDNDTDGFFVAKIKKLSEKGCEG
jgi:NOL1/NOP2/sun family putative RNA methylase